MAIKLYIALMEKRDTAYCSHGSYCHKHKQDKFIIQSIAITVALYELTMELNDRLLSLLRSSFPPTV